MDNGWVRVYRTAFSEQDRLWGENRERTRWEAWMDLIQQAAFKDHDVLYNGSLIAVERGQVPTSERRLATRWRWSRGKVRLFISQLEACSRIVRKPAHQKAHGFSVITICNYRDFQGDGPTEKPTEQPSKSPVKAQTEEGEEGKASIIALTDAGLAVLDFVRRVGSPWSLKASPDEWAAGLSRQYPRVQILAELGRAADWHEEAHSDGREYARPTTTIHNWLKKAQADAQQNGTTEAVPFGSRAARSYQ